MTRAILQPFPMLPGRRAQVWRHQPSYRRPRHFHREPEINFVARGHAVLGVGEKSVALSARELIVIPPGLDHELLDGSPDLALFVLALRPELADRAYDFLAHATNQVQRLDAARNAEIEALFAGLSEVRNASAVEVRLADVFKSTLLTLKPRHALSRRALLAWRGEQTLSETALAARLGVDLGALSRCLREDLGERFVEYRARHRLMFFVTLADRGRPFTSAALEAGFGSYAQCHRVFSRHLGCSPSAYFRGQRKLISEMVLPAQPHARPHPTSGRRSGSVR